MGRTEINDVLEQDSGNVACARTGGLDHISFSAGEFMRKLGQLPKQADEEPSCKRCDGTGAVMKKSHGRIYEHVCPCQNVNDG